MKKPLELSRLPSVRPRLVGRILMACLDAIQAFPPEEQAAAVGSLFLLVTRRLKVHPSRVLEVSSNVLERAYSETPEIRAAVMFTEKEL